MKHLLFWFCILVSTRAIFADDSNLARVAILEFSDKTDKSGYTWAGTSLPESIDKSMRLNFEYLRKDPDLVKKVAQKESRNGQNLSEETIGRIAEKTESEIIIYGDYTFDKSTEKIIINAKVYYHENEKVIGEVSEPSELNNQVFEKIDVIAKKIVDVIYRFTLQLDEEELKRRREQQKLRILVLVPSWSNEGEKKVAIAELETMKVELSKKYQARFLTIFELYREKKVNRREQRRVNRMAKAANRDGIISWLESKGIKDAFIVLVKENKVNVTTVASGQVKPAVTYNVDSTTEEKVAAIRQVSQKAGISGKTVIKKAAGLPALNISAGAGISQTATLNNDELPTQLNLRLGVTYHFFSFAMFEVGAAAATHATIVNRSNFQINPDSNLDTDYFFFYGQALAGPVISYNAPFLTKLQLSLLLYSGFAYSILDAGTESKSGDFTLMGIFEARYYFWQGLSAYLAPGYNHIFYKGKDLRAIQIALGVGYGF